MSTIACPFCGEIMNSPLKFCVSCGRAITQDDLNRAGLKIQKGQETTGRLEHSGKSFERAKRDHTSHRKVRSVMYTVSAVLMLVIGYYVIMKHVLHEALPGDMDVKLQQFIANPTLPPLPANPMEQTSAVAR